MMEWLRRKLAAWLLPVLKGGTGIGESGGLVDVRMLYGSFESQTFKEALFAHELADHRLIPSASTTPAADDVLQERVVALVDIVADERLRETVERLVEETLELKPIRVELVDGKLTLKLVGERAKARGEV